jgi:hypothetical protein
VFGTDRRSAMHLLTAKRDGTAVLLPGSFSRDAVALLYAQIRDHRAGGIHATAQIFHVHQGAILPHNVILPWDRHSANSLQASAPVAWHTLSRIVAAEAVFDCAEQTRDEHKVQEDTSIDHFMGGLQKRRNYIIHCALHCQKRSTWL